VWVLFWDSNWQPLKTWRNLPFMADDIENGAASNPLLGTRYAFAAGCKGIPRSFKASLT
jgi:hypothetical protein